MKYKKTVKVILTLTVFILYERKDTSMISNLATLILMGGQNKRMNGQHKAFLKLHEKSFLDQIITSLKSCGPIYLSVNDKSLYSHLPYPLIEDYYKEIGPIGGIYSTLLKVPSNYVFITACDMPFMEAEFVNYLYSQLEPDTSCIVVSDSSGRFYPLGGIYSKTMLPLIKEQIENENYRLGALLKRAGAKIVPLNETPFSEKLLRNINTPKEYEALLEK